MSNKFMVVALLGATLSGCSALAPVTGSHYTSRDGKLDIRGELIDSSDVRIFVNGDKVIDDQVSLMGGEGSFDGSWQGKRISADCSTGAGRRGATRCTVAVAGERVTLTL